MSPLLSFDGHRIAKHPYHVSPIVQDRQAVSSQLEFVTTLISSQDDSSDVSDLEKFDEAYSDFGALTKGVDPQTLERDGSANPNEEVPGIDLPGGMKALHSLANVPKSWPLARLTILFFFFAA